MTVALTADMQRELKSLRKEVADLQTRLERAHREVGAAQYEGQQQLIRLRTRAWGRLRDLARTWADEADAGGDDATRDTWQHCADELAQAMEDIFFEGEKS